MVHKLIHLMHRKTDLGEEPPPHHKTHWGFCNSSGLHSSRWCQPRCKINTQKSPLTKTQALLGGMRPPWPAKPLSGPNLCLRFNLAFSSPSFFLLSFVLTDEIHGLSMATEPNISASEPANKSNSEDHAVLP